MLSVTALLLLAAAPVAASPCPESSSPELPKLVLPSVKAEVAQIKPWTKGFCVALVQTLESEEKRAFAVALFAVGGGSLSTRLKATTGSVALPSDEYPSGLDLAKYAVTATQTAIGVRLRRHRTYAGNGEATLETLILYLPDGRDLEPILRTFTWYEAELAGDWLEDGSRDRVGYSGKATLVVSKKTTQGHFDLIRRTDSGTQHLRWNKGAYEDVDTDPFRKDVLEIFTAGE